MKKIQIAVFAIIAVLVGQAQASLIDLTPGGYNENSPPPVVNQFWDQFFISGMNFIAGAVVRNGQIQWSPFTVFGSANFNLTMNGPNGVAGWDILGTGYRVRYVWVQSWGVRIDNLYLVNGPDHYFSFNDLLTANGITNVGAVTFAGNNGSLPDGGSTAALMGMGLLAMGVYLKYGT